MLSLHHGESALCCKVSDRGKSLHAWPQVHMVTPQNSCMLMLSPLHAERETPGSVRTLRHHHPLQRQQLQQVSFPAVSFLL